MSNFNEQLLERRHRHVPRGVASATRLFIVKAEGALLTDVDGRDYIDFAGGIGVNNVGHRHPHVLAAIREQLDAYLHPCFSVMMYEPYVELAARLNEVVPCRGEKKTLFVNSGAEAVENAVKIARYHTRRPGVIAFDNAFHGRTLLTMTLTSKVRPYKLHMPLSITDEQLAEGLRILEDGLTQAHGAPER
jgi:4-aminobutyrate aminotransferase/(S)-3-amino-2-methylpropionate transaminase